MLQAGLKNKFYTAIAGNQQPNEWEVEEYLEPLSGLEDSTQQEIMNQVSVIWPVSHALCYNFISQVTENLTCLHPSQLADWVKAILDIYEELGLRQANNFMADAENNFLCRIRGEKGIKFDEVVGMLLPYARGITGRDLELLISDDTYTDTAAIFIPKNISLFAEGDDNFQLYKLLVTYQCGLLVCNVFADHHLPTEYYLAKNIGIKTNQHGKAISFNKFMGSFNDSRLILDLYHLVASIVVNDWLYALFPGLMRDCASILDNSKLEPTNTRDFSSKNRVVKALYQHLNNGNSTLLLNNIEKKYLEEAMLITERVRKNRYDLFSGAYDLYQILSKIRDSYSQTIFPIYWGKLKPDAIEFERMKMRVQNKEKFIKALALIIPSQSIQKSQKSEEESQTGLVFDGLQDSAAIIPPKKGQNEEDQEDKNKQPTDFITIDGQQMELPESLKQLMKDIAQDLGHIPEKYISSATDIAGGASSDFNYDNIAEGEELTGPILYDEWDFRRSGFRKNWCRLLQKDLHPIKSTFMNSTLTKYRASLIQLKRQFEMLCMQDRFIKKQQEGNDIDLDAMIESLADHRAGLSPSENLFIRLARYERDIAAVFLVDMSSSTEGWVNTALKESLVLMCEALEILGDRYAIYGFSGMRRTRSEIYHIKHLAEEYNDEVKGRIAAVKPIDYTRMGPPIRHITKMLAMEDSKVRLLITLSDGKPEDYDDYKGDYAIEDTRHALIEAKAAGIHPFCITIDKKAHDYMAYMYGEVNYIFIDDVNKLPLRIPEIYRTLTT